MKNRDIDAAHDTIRALDTEYLGKAFANMLYAVAICDNDQLSLFQTQAILIEDELASRDAPEILQLAKERADAQVQNHFDIMEEV